MLLLEINEFNPELMQQAATALDAPALKYLLSLQQSQTHTDEREERFGLDPWVQWVSIHTGKPATEHGVKHLADLHELQYPQLWETLGNQGIRCGVWGAMNASLGHGENIDFFLPDPWSFEQQAFPRELQDLSALPVYYAKHYGDLEFKALLQTSLRLLRFALKPSIFFTLTPVLPKLIRATFKHGLQDFLLFVIFDLVNARLFKIYYRRFQPQFSLLFLNSLAHLQHHQWTQKETLSEPMLFAFSLFNEILKEIFSTIGNNTPLLAANAFSQHCSYDAEEFLYRQINPEVFLQQSVVRFQKVEQLMTNDAHVFFNSVDEAIQAKAILEAATINDCTLFYVEYDEQRPMRIFYQVNYWQALAENSQLHINGKNLRFFDLFEQITQRSGSHVPEGHIFARGLDLPASMYNHEIYDYILRYFGSHAKHNNANGKSN